MRRQPPFSYNEVVRCKTCGYSLENLTGGRCPECGGLFDPRIPSSFRSPPTRKQLNRRFLVIAFWTYVAAVFLVILLVSSSRGFFSDRIDIVESLIQAIFLWPFIVVPSLLVAIWLHLRNR